MRLNWSDYKSTEGSRSVRFPGGFILYIVRRERYRKGVTSWRNEWRVTWWRRHEKKDGASHKEISAKEMPGLTDRWFKTRTEAMLAAEKIFVPILRIADEIVDVEIKVTTKSVFGGNKR